MPLYKLNILINCYNLNKSVIDFSRLEMTWVKTIELPFVPFLGLEITENDQYIIELKEFDENKDRKNTLLYDISTQEFSYWSEGKKFNSTDNRDNEYINREQLTEHLISLGYKLKNSKGV